MSLYNSISARLTIPLAIGMSLGFLLLILVIFDLHERQLSRQHDHMVSNLLESVNSGLQSVMIGGYADIAEDYAANLHSIPGIKDLSILRVNGLEAFQDNLTINEVNERKNEIYFLPREEEHYLQVMAESNSTLRQAVDDEVVQKTIGADQNGARIVTFISPILNGKDCYECHGKSQSVRGVLKLTLSLEELDNSLRTARNWAIYIVLAVTGALLLSLSFIVNRQVGRPLRQITGALVRISAGDFNQKVPDFSAEELKQMASSFNQMSDDLKVTYQVLEDEHNKINTLVHTAVQGMVVTNQDGSIVLVNSAAERILNKTNEQIINDGFVKLFDDEKIINDALTMAAKAENHEMEIVYNHLTILLKAATMTSANGEMVGSAALMRDITEEAALREMLERQSTTDALTGIFNRRFIDSQLKEELQRAERSKRSTVVLLFDIDHFKNFNDAWGHDQGDRVLQSIAEVMKSSIREIDYPCRYGGEEFVIILPETDEISACVIAERLRKNIAETSVDGLSVTISIGVAIAQADKNLTADMLVRHADEAMYRAKHRGRNKVVVYSELG